MKARETECEEKGLSFILHFFLTLFLYLPQFSLPFFRGLVTGGREKVEKERENVKEREREREKRGWR